MKFKELKDFAKDFDLKPQIIKVNGSSTFPVRSKCRFCMSGPEDYFIQKFPTKWYNPRRILEISAHAYKYSKRMCQDFYLVEEPKVFTGLIAFVAYAPYQSYNPSLHTKRGTHPVENVIEYLACSCGKTAWAFMQRNWHMRPDIKHRQARYSYPHRFADWF